jgi:hypothetical protein
LESLKVDCSSAVDARADICASSGALKRSLGMMVDLVKEHKNGEYKIDVRLLVLALALSVGEFVASSHRAPHRGGRRFVHLEEKDLGLART